MLSFAKHAQTALNTISPHCQAVGGMSFPLAEKGVSSSTSWADVLTQLSLKMSKLDRATKVSERCLEQHRYERSKDATSSSWPYY